MLALRIANLLLTALALGLLAAHVLEVPGKLRLGGAEWLAVQQNLYIGFGTLGAAIELAAIGSAWVLAWRLRGRPAGRAALLAAAAGSAGLAVWAGFTTPVNRALSGWTPATLPADWQAWRNRWEASHAVHAACVGLAFLALARAALLDGERASPETAA